MNELIPINYEDPERPAVSGRDLHAFLGIETRYNDWFPRMCEYGFSEGQDYCSFLSNRSDGLPGKSRTDHILSLDMAKELCMIQRTERGKQARQYFIQLEKAWNSPEQVMARALKLANRKIESLSVENSKLTVQNSIMAPKADYFDELVDRNLLTNFRDTAKQLGTRQKDFIKFLLEKKYLYRDQSGKLQPYADKVEAGLFQVKENFNEKTHWAGTQTLVTPKGRETFRLLCEGM